MADCLLILWLWWQRLSTKAPFNSNVLLLWFCLHCGYCCHCHDKRQQQQHYHHQLHLYHVVQDCSLMFFLFHESFAGSLQKTIFLTKNHGCYIWSYLRNLLLFGKLLSKIIIRNKSCLGVWNRENLIKGFGCTGDRKAEETIKWE